MKESEVRAELEKYELNWSDFMEWMRGQTISADEQGNTIYHTTDVRHFITLKTTGKKQVDWD